MFWAAVCILDNKKKFFTIIDFQLFSKRVRLCFVCRYCKVHKNQNPKTLEPWYSKWVVIRAAIDSWKSQLDIQEKTIICHFLLWVEFLNPPTFRILMAKKPHNESFSDCKILIGKIWSRAKRTLNLHRIPKRIPIFAYHNFWACKRPKFACCLRSNNFGEFFKLWIFSVRMACLAGQSSTMSLVSKQ